MPLATVCNRHRVIIVEGEQCAACKREQAERGKPRRQANKVRLGRQTRHWRELSFRMIRRHRASFGPTCPECRRSESADDPSSKLTVDLIRGGDHSTAREDECRVICRRCHGRAQGGAHDGGVSLGRGQRTSPLAAPLGRNRSAS